jgi:hypothetical protein
MELNNSDFHSLKLLILKASTGRKKFLFNYRILGMMWNFESLP